MSLTTKVKPVRRRRGDTQGAPTMPKRTKALEATAYHEAGHAVVALAKIVAFETVTIIPGDDSMGAIRFHSEACNDLVSAHNHGAISLAGEIAQRRFSPSGVRRYQGQSDRDQVLFWATEWSSSAEQANLLVRLWEVQAREIITARWRAVEDIANALLERGTLTFEETHELYLPPHLRGRNVRPPGAAAPR